MPATSHVPVPLAAVHASISEQLHRRLRTAIIRGDIAPGETLSETEVGRTYSVSRQPVREAFIKLAQEGLLEVVPNRGTRVRRISMREALDARFVREAVEAAVAREAAQHATPADVAALRRLVAEQRAVARDDADAFLALDEAFHRALAVAARREHAWTTRPSSTASRATRRTPRKRRCAPTSRSCSRRCPRSRPPIRTRSSATCRIRTMRDEATESR